MLAAVIFTFVVDIVAYVSLIHPYIDKYRAVEIAAGRLAENVDFNCHIMTAVVIVVFSIAALLVWYVLKFLAKKFLP